MTDATCPACGELIEDVHRVGPVTAVLEPCDHQVDDWIYSDLLDV